MREASSARPWFLLMKKGSGEMDIPPHINSALETGYKTVQAEEESSIPFEGRC